MCRAEELRDLFAFHEGMPSHLHLKLAEQLARGEIEAGKPAPKEEGGEGEGEGEEEEEEEEAAVECCVALEQRASRAGAARKPTGSGAWRHAHEGSGSLVSGEPSGSVCDWRARVSAC